MENKMILGKEMLTTIYNNAKEDLKDPYINLVLSNLDNGKVMLSERMSAIFSGILFDLKPEEKEKLQAIEKKYEVKVCHIIKTYMTYGEEYTFVMCPKNEEELKCLEIEGKIARVFTAVSNDFGTELGYAGIRTVNGGFERAW